MLCWATARRLSPGEKEMKPWKSRVALVAVVFGVLVVPTLFDRRSLITRITVPSRADWSAGPAVVLEPGTTFTIDVDTAERWSSGSWSGTADGDTPQWGGYALPGARAYSLIGRFGPDGSPFFIGSRYEGTAPANGALMLAMNDVPGSYWDNRGELTVVVTVP